MAIACLCSLWPARLLGEGERAPLSLLFLMDSSGSMNDNDRADIRIAAGQAAVALLSPQDQVAVLQFDSRAKALTPGKDAWVNAGDRDAIFSALRGLKHDGQPEEERPPIEEVATQLARAVTAVKEFLRRVLPRGQRPWTEKPRWSPAEIESLQHNGGPELTRSPAAIKKYLKRHCDPAQEDPNEERVSLTVTQVAGDLGVSRASVYRLLKRGALRRFKGGIAETSFSDLLREHPEAIPYSKLPRDQKEWLVLNGYSDPSLVVKRPSVRGILE